MKICQVSLKYYRQFYHQTLDDSRKKKTKWSGNWKMMIWIQNLATKTRVQSIKKWANIEPLYTVAILDVLNMINDLSKKKCLKEINHAWHKEQVPFNSWFSTIAKQTRKHSSHLGKCFETKHILTPFVPNVKKEIALKTPVLSIEKIFKQCINQQFVIRSLCQKKIQKSIQFEKKNPPWM